MYTLTSLPARGRLYVFVTATRVNFDDAEDGVAETGWVDHSWSPTTLQESRNDVRPLWDGDTFRILNGHTYATAAGDSRESAEDVRADILDNIRNILGHVDSSDRGTLYASDHVTWDYATSDTFAYAAHVVVKHHDATRGWVEDDVHIPAEDINAR